MLSTIKSEIKMIFTNSRINRLRYLAYLGLMFIIVGLLSTLLSVGLFYLYPNWIEHTNLKSRYLLLSPLIITNLALKIWLMNRRLNDLGQSFRRYLKYIFSGLLLIFLPSFFIDIFGLNISTTSLPAGYKLVVALSYLIGMISLMGALLIIGLKTIFFKGTPDDNKYGAIPPPNNYFTIIFSSVFLVMIALEIAFIFYTFNKPNILTADCQPKTDNAYQQILPGTWVGAETYEHIKPNTTLRGITKYSADKTLKMFLVEEDQPSTVVLTGDAKWKIENGNIIQFDLQVCKKEASITDFPANLRPVDKLLCTNGHYFKSQAEDGTTLEFVKIGDNFPYTETKH